MRRGFGLMVAIVIMMSVSLLMTMMLSYATGSAKTTVDLYLKEQAELLTRSATEYALLAISGHDNSQNCIEQINMRYPDSVHPTHEVNMTLWYIGSGIQNCAHVLENTILTKESNLTVIIDTIVQVNQENTGITEPIRIHRRSIQKP